MINMFVPFFQGQNILWMRMMRVRGEGEGEGENEGEGEGEDLPTNLPRGPFLVVLIKDPSCSL
jgi:hypothetical protein